MESLSFPQTTNRELLAGRRAWAICKLLNFQVARSDNSEGFYDVIELELKGCVAPKELEMLRGYYADVEGHGFDERKDVTYVTLFE